MPPMSISNAAWLGPAYGLPLAKIGDSTGWVACGNYSNQKLLAMTAMVSSHDIPAFFGFGA